MIVLTIEGMMCPRCQKRVENALNGLPGVTVAVNLENKTATVTGDVTPETVKQAVVEAGYTVTSVMEK